MSDDYKVTPNGAATYKAVVNSEKTSKYLYYREKVTKNGREYKVDAGKTDFFMKIAHLFKRTSTHYYYGERAVEKIKENPEFAKILGATEVPKEEPSKGASHERPKEGVNSKVDKIPDEEGDTARSHAASIEEGELPNSIENSHEGRSASIGNQAASEGEDIPHGTQGKPQKIEPKKPSLVQNITNVISKIMKPISNDDFEDYNIDDFVDVMPNPEAPGIKQGTNIPNNMQFETYRTRGDGSCGIHAMFGELQSNGEYVCTDAPKYRKEYCDSIRKTIKENKNRPLDGQIDLPLSMTAALTDFFLDLNQAPQSFREHAQIERAYRRHHNEYNALDKESQDGRKESWLNDPDVIDVYLEQLEKRGTYLLQEELLDIGKFINKSKGFNKTIYLVQKGWGNASNQIHGLNAPAIEGTGKPIYVWYVPNVHYERGDYRKK